MKIALLCIAGWSMFLGFILGASWMKYTIAAARTTPPVIVQPQKEYYRA